MSTAPTMIAVIRPWYRSRLFWLGLPGMLFLVWLSWIFPPRILTRTGPSGVHQLYAYGSTLMFCYEPCVASPGWEVSAPHSGLKDIVPQGGPWVKWDRVVEPAGLSGTPRVDYVFLRSWLPAVVYLVVWVAVVASWQRYKSGRMRRTVEAG